jgi:hypothetical protein
MHEGYMEPFQKKVCLMQLGAQALENPMKTEIPVALEISPLLMI